LHNLSSNQIVPYLWQLEDHQVFAILDMASNKAIFKKVVFSGLPYRRLYRGQLPPILEEHVPYLVQLEMNSPLTTWLLDRGFGKSWGVYVCAKASADDMLRHFKRLLKVKLPDKKVVHFRFYDPRILRVFLPTCTRHELAYIFGKQVAAFWMENEDCDGLVAFSRDHGELMSHDHIMVQHESA